MDAKEIGLRCGKSVADVNQCIETAKRSLVPVSRKFDVIEAGRSRTITVTREGVGPLTTPRGDFHHFAFTLDDPWVKYSVLVHAALDAKFRPIFRNQDKLVMRIDSGCETGQLFLDRTCECRDQLLLAMSQINDAGEGLIVHIPRQDGRGMGLPFKLATLRLQAELGLDTTEAPLMLEPDASRDVRTYSGVVAILRFLEIPLTTQLLLATNNPKKMQVFAENGYAVPERKPIVIAATDHTRRHLQAKQQALGHLALVEEAAASEPLAEISPWAQRVQSAIASRTTRVCCGLDPDPALMPAEFNGEKPDDVAAFLEQIVNLTCDQVCAYKVQKAFFEPLPAGKEILKRVIEHIRATAPDLPVILDCKIGDIGNTMKAYFTDAFTRLSVDAVLVNPYMGPEVWREVNEHEGKGVFVLVRTSNPGSSFLQEMSLSNEQRVWQYVLEEVLKEWRAGRSVMPVISSNTILPSSSAESIRAAGVPVLIAGYGAQGGSLANVSPLLLGDSASFVTSSRALIYPYEPVESDWRESVRKSVISMRDDINRVGTVSS